MRLLRYFARYYAGVLALMQLGLVIIVLATTFVESAGQLARSDEGAVAAAGIALWGAVEFGYQVFPVACFLALLVAGTLLARSGELLAVQAAGMGSQRAAGAILAVVLVTVLGGVIAGEWAVPRASAQLAEARRGGGSTASNVLGGYYDRHAQWFRQGDLLVHMPQAELETSSFGDVVVYRFAEGLIGSITDARRLVWDEGGWWLLDAREQIVATAEVRRYDRLALGIAVSPQDLLEVAGEPRLMRRRDLDAVVTRRERAGFDTVPYRIELENRLAFPLSALSMALLAVPWALDPNRRRSLAVNLGAGVVVIAVLLSLTQVLRYLALSHRVPAALGAWGVDLACVALVPASWGLFRRHRRRGTIF